LKGISSPLQIITKASDSYIASVAEESTDFAGLMTVINVPLITGSSWLATLAAGAYKILCRKKIVKLF
jgi:uncharacterized membrane protein